MTTADMALRMDPIYGPISKRFHENPDEFADAFARAWFKLTHRDMGPKACYLGDEVPAENLIWQDPVPAARYVLTDTDITSLKSMLKDSGLTASEMVYTAWSSASTYRHSDKRGGANGARIRLSPQNDWQVNQPAQLKKVLSALESIQGQFNSGDKEVSLADLIVLAGNVGVEMSLALAGNNASVPFNGGRTDATAEQTDAESFAVLESQVDGFRNFIPAGLPLSPEEMVLDKTHLLNLTAPEMTVLIGGLRVINANYQSSELGVLTNTPGTLDNSYFVTLLDMGTKWQKASKPYHFVGVDRSSGEPKWTATSVDLAIGSNSELRAIAEVYASDDAKEKFVNDFIAAWVKVMELDRFDIK